MKKEMMGVTDRISHIYINTTWHDRLFLTEEVKI